MSGETNEPSEPGEVRRLRQLAKAKGFLAREFLLWLWFKAESDESWVDLGSASDDLAAYGRVQLWIDDRVVLEATTGHAHLHTLKGGDPSHSVEASAALQSGKSVKELKLGVEIGNIGEMTFVLDAFELTPKSVQIVKSPDGGDLGDDFSPLAFRLVATDVICHVLDHLFNRYLILRTDSASYAQLQEDLKKWVRNRVVSAETLLH